MEQEILALEHAAMERWRKGDPFGWTEISSDDIIYMEPNLAKPIIGLQAYKDYFKPAVGQIIYQGSEFIDPKVVVVGDAAVLSYNYRSTVQSAEGQILNQNYWNASEVYFKIKQEWKIVHTHWSYAPHTQPESVELPITIQTSPVKFDGVLKELMDIEPAAMKLWRTGDQMAPIANYAPEITYFDPDTAKRVDGRDALTDLYNQWAGQIYYEVMDFIEPQVRVCGDMAVLCYRFCAINLNPDGSVASRTPMNCTEVYIKRDGQWMIIHNHWSYVNGVKN